MFSLSAASIFSLAECAGISQVPFNPSLSSLSRLSCLLSNLHTYDSTDSIRSFSNEILVPKRSKIDLSRLSISVFLNSTHTVSSSSSTRLSLYVLVIIVVAGRLLEGMGNSIIRDLVGCNRLSLWQLLHAVVSKPRSLLYMQ